MCSRLKIPEKKTIECCAIKIFTKYVKTSGNSTYIINLTMKMENSKKIVHLLFTAKQITSIYIFE